MGIEKSTTFIIIMCMPMCMSIGWQFFVHNFVAQVAYTLAQLFFRYIFVGIEQYIPCCKVHLYIFHPLFFEVSVNIDRTGAAIHSFNFPLNFFHNTGLYFNKTNERYNSLKASSAGTKLPIPSCYN